MQPTPGLSGHGPWIWARTKPSWLVLDSSAERILRAVYRASLSSLASQTVEYPPKPSLWTTLYRPWKRVSDPRWVKSTRSIVLKILHETF